MHNDKIQVTTPVEPDRQSLAKKRPSIWSKIAFLLILLLLASVAINAWLWYLWQDAKNQQANLQSEVSNAQSAIANLREQIGTKNGQAAAEAAIPINDEAVIIESVKKYNAVLGTPLQNIKIEIDRRDGVKAITNVSNITAGYKAYLKKSGNTWLVVWSGQDIPPTEVAEMFGL